MSAMPRHAEARTNMLWSRRDLLFQVGGGLAGIALSWLASQDGLLADPPIAGRFHYDLAPRPPHFPPRAQAVICLFMQGGPSQMDLFDPKPELTRRDGQRCPAEIEIFGTGNSGQLLASPFRFGRHGRSGLELSELLPHLGRVADDLTVIRSMWTHHNNHIPAQLMFNTGRIFGGRPGIGAWIAYGLGTENQNLPAYIALPDTASLPVDGPRNWTAGWLPPLFQGTQLSGRGTPIFDLHRPASLSAPQQEANLELLGYLNRRHLQAHPGLPELEARITNYELAARMQTAAARQVDITGETPAVRRLYGLENPRTQGYGLRCLLARRLVESGVRFVHVFTPSQAWDQHSGLRTGLANICGAVDQPIAGLLTDLKQRGLLETTLVIFAGEFGRLPIAQNRDGRDHNRHAFSIWLAGGGIRGGISKGATDDFGYAAVSDRVSVSDLQATILHLVGLDHRRLTYRHLNRVETLTDVNPARVLTELLA
jgi:hypothetical protein